jgi:hypothetical protein
MEFLEALHALRDPAGIFIWAFPPIAGLIAYLKFSRTIAPPVYRTAKQMLAASGLCFLLCLLFLIGGAIDVHLSQGKEFTPYFGLAFPQPPGRFAAMSMMCAIPGFLFGLHAGYSKLRRKDTRR